MKKTYVILLAGMLALASCGQKYTCPTYTKAPAGKTVQAAVGQVKP